MTQKGPSDNPHIDYLSEQDIKDLERKAKNLEITIQKRNQTQALGTMKLLQSLVELSNEIPKPHLQKINDDHKPRIKALRNKIRQMREGLFLRLENKLKELLDDSQITVAVKQEVAIKIQKDFSALLTSLKSTTDIADLATSRKSGRLVSSVISYTTDDIGKLLEAITRSMLDGQDFDTWKIARLAEIHVKKKKPTDKLKLLRACYDNFIDGIIPDQLLKDYKELKATLIQAFGNEYNRLVRVAEILVENPEFETKRKITGLEQVQRVFLENEPPIDEKIDDLFSDASHKVAEMLGELDAQLEEGLEYTEDDMEAEVYGEHGDDGEETYEDGAEIVYSEDESAKTTEQDAAPEGSWVGEPDERRGTWIGQALKDEGGEENDGWEEAAAKPSWLDEVEGNDAEAPEGTAHLERPDLPGEESGDGDGEATLEMDMPATLRVFNADSESPDPDGELTTELDPPPFLGPANPPSPEDQEGEEKVNKWLRSRHEIFDRAENPNIPLFARIDGICGWLKDYHSSFEGEVFSEKTNEDVEAAFTMGLKILLWTERKKSCLMDQVEEEVKEYIEKNQKEDYEELEKKAKKKTARFASLLPRVQVQTDDEEWDLYKYKKDALGRKILQALFSIEEDDTISEELKVAILNADKDEIASIKWHEEIDRKIKNLLENIQDRTTKKIELSIFQQELKESEHEDLSPSQQELKESAHEGLPLFQQNVLKYVLQVQFNNAFLKAFFDETHTKPTWHDTSAQQIRRPGTSRLARRPFPDQTVLLNDEQSTQKEGRQLEAFFEEAEAVGRLKKEIENMSHDGNAEEQLNRLTEIRAVVDKLFAAEKIPQNDHQELCNLIEEKREELEGSAGNRLLLIGKEANTFERLRTTVQVMNPNGNIDDQLTKLDAISTKALDMYEEKIIEEKEYEELCDLILEKREELEGSVRSKKRKVRLAIAAVLVGLGVVGGNQLRPYGSNQPKTLANNTPNNGSGTQPRPTPGIIDPVIPGRGDTAPNTSESVAVVESNTAPRELSQQEREILERTFAMLNNFWSSLKKDGNTETPDENLTEPDTEPPIETVVHHPGVPERYTVETIQTLMRRVEMYLEVADNIEDPIATYNAFFSDDFNGEPMPGLVMLRKDQLESKLARYEAERDAELAEIQNLYQSGNLASEMTQNSDLTLEDRNEGHRLMYETLRGSLTAMRRHLESIWKLQQIKTALEALPEPTPVTPEPQPTTPPLTAEQLEILEATTEMLSHLWSRIGKGNGSSADENPATEPTQTITPEQNLAKAWEIHRARQSAVVTALDEAISTLRAELERQRADYQTQLEAHQTFTNLETANLEETHREELAELRQNEAGLSADALMAAEVRMLRKHRQDRRDLDQEILEDMHKRKIDDDCREDRMANEVELLQAIRQLEAEKESDRIEVSD